MLDKDKDKDKDNVKYNNKDKDNCLDKYNINPISNTYLYFTENEHNSEQEEVDIDHNSDDSAKKAHVII